MLARRRWLWLLRPKAMIALIVVTALLLAFGLGMRLRDGGATDDELRIVAVAATATTPDNGASAAPGSPTVAQSPAATLAPTATPTTTPAVTASPSATAADLPALTAPASATSDAADAGASTGTGTGTAEDTAPSSAVVITLHPQQVGVGETMLVRVRAFGADSGSLTFRGQSFPLAVEGDDLWAVVGIPIQAPVGDETLTVTARDAAGNVLATANAGYAVVPVERPIQNLILTEEESSVLTPQAGQREFELRQQQFARFDRGRRWNGQFARPLAGPITTQFGEGRRINNGPPGSFHSGTDIANDQGMPVIASAPGRVSWAGEMPIRGNTVILDHGAGVLTHYSHLSVIEVAVDHVVRPGERVGLVGSTGLSTGPHLHWELSIYGVNVDPMEWIAKDFTPRSVTSASP